MRPPIATLSQLGNLESIGGSSGFLRTIMLISCNGIFIISGMVSGGRVEISDCGPASHSPRRRSSSETFGKSSSESNAKSPPFPFLISETNRSNRAGFHSSRASSMGKSVLRWRMAYAKASCRHWSSR